MIILSGFIPTFTLKIKVDFNSTCRLRSLCIYYNDCFFTFEDIAIDTINQLTQLVFTNSLVKLPLQSFLQSNIQMYIRSFLSNPLLQHFGFDLHCVGREVVHTVSIYCTLG